MVPTSHDSRHNTKVFVVGSRPTRHTICVILLLIFNYGSGLYQICNLYVLLASVFSTYEKGYSVSSTTFQFTVVAENFNLLPL